MKKYVSLTTFTIVCILAIGISTRFYKLGNIPVSLYWDEVAMLVDAKSVAQTGKDMHGKPSLQSIFISYGDYKLPVYIWLASASVKLFGVSEWSLRLPSAVIGILHIFIIGYLAKEMFTPQKKEKKTEEKGNLQQKVTQYLLDFPSLSKTSMFILAITPWAIQFSRTGFEGHVGQFFLTLSVLFMFLSKKRKWLLFIASILGALSVYTYFSVRFVWPTLYAFFLLSYIKAFLIFLEKKQTSSKNTLENYIQQINIRDSLKNGFIILSAFVLWSMLLIPMFQSPVYRDSQTFRLSTSSILDNHEQIMNSNIYREQAGNGPISRVIYHRWFLTFQKLAENYADNLDFGYLFITGDPNLRHSTGTFGLFLCSMIPLCVAGFYFLWKQKKSSFLFLIIWWIIALLPASVPQDTPHALRSLNALTPLVLIIGYGTTHLSKQLTSFFSKYKIKISQNWIIIFISGILLMNFTFYFHDYLAHYPKRSAPEWQEGYKELATTLIEYKNDVDAVYIEPFDDRFYLWVMAYGPYGGKNFRTWKSEKYLFKEFDNFIFSQPNLELVRQTKQTILLAGNSYAMNKDLSTIINSATWKKEIVCSNGEVCFIVIKYSVKK